MKTDFLEILFKMAEIKVTGARQQAVVYILFKLGPMRHTEIFNQLPKDWAARNIQLGPLIDKKIIVKKRTMFNGRTYPEYRLREEITQFLEL